MLTRVACLRCVNSILSTRPAVHPAQRFVGMSANSADDEQVAKRQKVESKDMHTMDINTAVQKPHEKKALSELVDAPVSVLQGVGPKSAEVLGELGVHTVKDLAEFKCASRLLQKSHFAHVDDTVCVALAATPGLVRPLNLEWLQPWRSGGCASAERRAGACLQARRVQPAHAQTQRRKLPLARANKPRLRSVRALAR